MKEYGIVPADLNAITVAKFQPVGCTADNVSTALNRLEISEFLNAPEGSYSEIAHGELLKANNAIANWPCTDDEWRWLKEARDDYPNATATCGVHL